VSVSRGGRAALKGWEASAKSLKAKKESSEVTYGLNGGMGMGLIGILVYNKWV
jgi:hypothetical protein